MKRNSERKLMGAAIRLGSVCVLGLGVVVGPATVRAASDNVFTNSISSEQANQGAQTSESVDGCAASLSVFGSTPGVDILVFCCSERHPSERSYPYKPMMCTVTSAVRCMAHTGQIVQSCRQCQFHQPRLEHAGAESGFGESSDDWTDEAMDSDPSDPTRTASAWTLLVATLFLAGL